MSEDDDTLHSDEITDTDFLRQHQLDRIHCSYCEKRLTVGAQWLRHVVRAIWEESLEGFAIKVRGTGHLEAREAGDEVQLVVVPHKTARRYRPVSKKKRGTNHWMSVRAREKRKAKRDAKETKEDE